MRSGPEGPPFRPLSRRPGARNGTAAEREREYSPMRQTCLAFLAVTLGVFAACTSGKNSRDADPHTNAEGAVRTKSVQLPVIHDFRVSPALPAIKLVDVDAPTIQAGYGSVAIIAVRRPSIPARCLVAAQLRLYLKDRSGVAAELAIYPSHVFNATEKREGDDFGYSGSALDIRPRATLDEATTGWSQWDVTDIVKLWLRRGAFPSQGASAPKRGPIVLTLRDVDGGEPFGSVTFVSADASDNTPHLIATHKGKCDAA